MALQTIVAGGLFPDDFLASAPAGGASTIDATGEAVACIWRSPINGTIRSITFRLGTVTTGDVISVEVQTVLTTSAIPSDTLWATGTAMSLSLTTTMAASWQTVSLSAFAAVSFGDIMALVIKRNDTLGAGNFQVSRIGTAFNIQANAATKALVWSPTATNVMCIFANYSETSSVALYKHNSMWSPVATALSAGAATDELGNIVNLPFRARVTGFYLNTTFSAGGVTKVRLYDTDGSTVMASRTLDHDNTQFGAPLITLPFESATVLAINSDYRIAAFVSTGAATMYRLSAANATAVGALHLGSRCYATSRVNGGAWADSTDARFHIGLIIDQLDDSAASGGAAGGLAHIIGSQ